MADIDFEQLADKVRNWGRWGTDDQRGTLNFINGAALQRAAASAISGKLFSLGLAFDKNGPQLGVRRQNPQLFVTDLARPLNPSQPSACFNDDVIIMPLQAATQWDALGHAHYDGVLYNGCKACDTLSADGASRLGVQHMATPGVMSRGVLLDIARLRGVDILPTDYAITPDDLNQAVAQTGLTIETGDVILVRTGHMRHFTVAKDKAKFCGLQPGVTQACAEWFHDHNVAAVCADNLAVEIIPPGMGQQNLPLPFHMLALRDMGCPLGEMFDLEALAADCAEDGRYAFLLAAPPLAVTGAFGSPVNPLALK